MTRLVSIETIAIAACFAVFSACDDSSSSPAPKGNHGITVLSPNGGEAFVSGGSIPVRWSYSPDSLTSAVVQISCNGIDWASLVRSSIDLGGELADPATFDTTLTIPDSVPGRMQGKNIPLTGSSCRLKVFDYQFTSTVDTSDAVFTVNPR